MGISRGVLLSSFVLLCLLATVSASNYPNHAQNVPFSLTVSSNNATDCNFTYIQIPNGTSIFYNLPMAKTSNVFNIVVSGGNFTDLGDTCLGVSCTDGSTFESGSICRNVTPNGFSIDLPGVLIYLLFFAIFIFLGYYSFLLITNHPIDQDPQIYAKLYQIKKRNEIRYYIEMIKQKLYIVGAFGLYLSIFIFISLLNQLVYNLGFNELNALLIGTTVVMAWGFIPFTVFWFVYTIILFYKMSTEILKYQYGNIGLPGRGIK